MTAFPLDDTNYLAQDMRLFHAGRTPGILNVTGSDFQVKASGGMNLTVSDGVAYTHTKLNEFGGVIFSPGQAVELTAPVAEYYTRYDYVAIRYTQTSNQVQVVYVKGNAEMPTEAIQNQTQYDLIIAIIVVPANAGSISPENIMDTRLNEKFCGLTIDTLSKIPTQQFYEQWNSFFERVQKDMSGNPTLSMQKQIDELKVAQNDYMKE